MAAADYRLDRGIRSGCAVADFSHACLIRLTDYPELPLRTGTQDVVKAGQTALVVRTQFTVGGRPISVAYKRIRRKNWWKVLTALVRPSGVLRTWRLGHELLARGIATARPLAAVVPRRPWRDRNAYVATEWIVGAENLDGYCRKLDLQPAAGRRVHRAAVALGRLIGRMHAQRISHRDLKAGNLLLRDGNGDVDAFLVDLDGAALRRQLSPQLRGKNLARLIVAVEPYVCVSRSVCLRFLKTYLEQLGEPAERWRGEWRRLASLAAARAARRRRAHQRKAA